MDNQIKSTGIKQRYLITTPHNILKNTGKPILLLGEWCRLFHQRENLKNEDIELHPYHWNDRNKFAEDYYFLDNFYENKLISLSESLSSVHGVTSDIRYWRIIIGPWLRFFIDAVFDRYELIRTAKDTGKIYSTSVMTYSLDDWIPSDFNEFYSQFREDSWNHIIFSECIKAQGLKFELDIEALLPYEKGKLKQNSVKRLLKFLMEIYAVILPSSLNKVVMVAAYLPLKKLKKLQMYLNQWPYLTSPFISVSKKNRDQVKRAQLGLSNAETPFEKLLDKLICELIPYSYLENFQDFKNQGKCKFPSDPCLIFTANAYQADDGFKVWAAGHVLNRVPLVIGQHGGHFGIGLLNQTEDHQVRIADVFATWGWTDKKNKNIIPLPAMKLPSEPVSCNVNGDILLVTASYPRYFYCHFSTPIAGLFVDYLDDQIRFCKSLKDSWKDMLKIRTDADIFGWEIHERFKYAELGESLDQSNEKFFDRLRNCRICVSSYNATVFLETLSANIPTIVFFDPNKYEIRAEAIGAMISLRAANILHDSPESAANFLNSLPPDISGWWNSEEVQETRRQFCQSFANTSENWMDVWKSFFKQMIKSSLKEKTSRHPNIL